MLSIGADPDDQAHPHAVMTTSIIILVIGLVVFVPLIALDTAARAAAVSTAARTQAPATP
jgi:hypothetical protein